MERQRRAADKRIHDQGLLTDPEYHPDRVYALNATTGTWSQIQAPPAPLGMRYIIDPITSRPILVDWNDGGKQTCNLLREGSVTRTYPKEKLMVRIDADVHGQLFLQPQESAGARLLYHLASPVRALGSWLSSLVSKTHWWFVSGVAEVQVGNTYYIPLLGDVQVEKLEYQQVKKGEDSYGRTIWKETSNLGQVHVQLLSDIRTSMKLDGRIFDVLPKYLISTRVDEERKKNFAPAPPGSVSLHEPK